MRAGYADDRRVDRDAEPPADSDDVAARPKAEPVGTVRVGLHARDYGTRAPEREHRVRRWSVTRPADKADGPERASPDVAVEPAASGRKR
jgi:hypothetical protein